MREILFRGKRVDNGEWVYGWYAPLICNDKTVIPYIRNENGTDKEVIPETVGQYTGLTDKNGTKVFEGDCIGCRENVVEYLDGTFTINGDRPLSWLKGTNGFIIVGNIYDNPELLEVEK